MSTRHAVPLSLVLLLSLLATTVPLLAAAPPSAPAPAAPCASAAGPDALAAILPVAGAVEAPAATPVAPLGSPLAGALAAATCICSDDDCFATCGPCGGTVWACRTFNNHCAAICYCRVC